MRILIDGYNLAHASTWLALKGRVREPEGLRHMLVEMLVHYAEHTDDAMTLIFDGLPADHQRTINRAASAGIEVIFSGHNDDADGVIERMLDLTTGARDMLVVSSDRRIRTAAAHAGARSSSSGEFFNRMRTALTRPDPAAPTEPNAKYTGVPPADVPLWLRILGFEDDSNGDT